MKHGASLVTEELVRSITSAAVELLDLHLRLRGVGDSERETLVATIGAQVDAYVRERVVTQADEIICQALALLRVRLAGDAFIAALYAAEGDVRHTRESELRRDEDFRRTVDETTAVWAARPRGRRRAKGAPEAAHERAVAKGQVEAEKRRRAASNQSARRDDVLQAVARERGVSVASLDRLLYPRRSRRR